MPKVRKWTKHEERSTLVFELGRLMALDPIRFGRELFGRLLPTEAERREFHLREAKYGIRIHPMYLAEIRQRNQQRNNTTTRCDTTSAELAHPG